MYVADITDLQDARNWERIVQEDYDVHVKHWGATSQRALQLAMDLEDIRERIAELGG